MFFSGRMRLRKMSYKTKLCVVVVTITITLLTNRTIISMRSSIDTENKAKTQLIKKLAKDENLEKVKRISAKFAPFQLRFSHDYLNAVPQFYDNNVAEEIASQVKLKNESKSIAAVKTRVRPNNDNKDSFLTYIEYTTEADLKDEFANLHKYKFILNNEYACNGDVLIVILIHSDPRKIDERKSIRESWGSVRFYSGANMVPLFLLARVNDDTLQKQLVLESKVYLDIIQGNFIDSYRNLTYKSVMGLHWVQNYCDHAKFVVKVDDDTLIDIYHLVNFLFQTSPDGNLNNFLYCSVFRNQGPRRTTDDKWFVTEHEYPYSKYPPYCEGFAYIMSFDVSKSLYETSSEVKFYWIDDVFVTGFVALKAGVFQRDLEHGHGYSLLKSEHLSKNVQSSIFLLAKYEFLRKNWFKAWSDILSFHNIE